MSDSVAVLTGDLIRSSASDRKQVDSAISALSEAANAISKWPYGRPARFTRFRGDGWHIVVNDPKHAFRAAIYLHARMRMADLGIVSRISIGIGRVDSLGTENLADASGAAFMISGRGLDNMKRGQLLTADGDGISLLHRAIILLAAERASRWSKEQAEAISLDMTNEVTSLADSASRLGISTQAVSARLSSAGFQAMREAMQIWETYNAHLWQPSFDI